MKILTICLALFCAPSFALRIIADLVAEKTHKINPIGSASPGSYSVSVSDGTWRLVVSDGTDTKTTGGGPNFSKIFRKYSHYDYGSHSLIIDIPWILLEEMAGKENVIKFFVDTKPLGMDRMIYPDTTYLYDFILDIRRINKEDAFFSLKPQFILGRGSILGVFRPTFEFRKIE